MSLYFLVPTECSTYSLLSDAWRNASFGKGVNCDQNLPDVWYRFTPPAGVRLLSSCIPKHRCGTYAPMWMNGKHPTECDGIVNRPVCGSFDEGCCQYKHNIKVRQCPGPFYIYRFGRVPFCSLAFCGTGKEKRRVDCFPVQQIY